MDLGLSTQQIERIYRGLFAHSMGFNQMIKQIGKMVHDEIDPAKRGKRDFLGVNLWRVFQILLEYCQMTDYQMLLNKAQVEFQAELLEKQELLMQQEIGYAAREHELK